MSCKPRRTFLLLLKNLYLFFGLSFAACLLPFSEEVSFTSQIETVYKLERAMP